MSHLSSIMPQRDPILALARVSYTLKVQNDSSHPITVIYLWSCSTCLINALSTNKVKLNHLEWNITLRKNTCVYSILPNLTLRILCLCSHYLAQSRILNLPRHKVNKKTKVKENITEIKNEKFKIIFFKVMVNSNVPKKIHWKYKDNKT